MLKRDRSERPEEYQANSERVFYEQESCSNYVHTHTPWPRPTPPEDSIPPTIPSVIVLNYKRPDRAGLCSTTLHIHTHTARPRRTPRKNSIPPIMPERDRIELQRRDGSGIHDCAQNYGNYTNHAERPASGVWRLRQRWARSALRSL